MNETSTDARSVIVEREYPYPPEKVWRALTEQQLIEEWLLKNDFEPVVGYRFTLSADWGHVDGEVLTVEPAKTLSYTWGDDVLKSVVTWTLVPTNKGTHLRMEQTGFRTEPQRYYQGAKAGWPGFLSRLEKVLERMD